MDDSFKRRIRGIAKRLHWLIQIVLLIVIVSSHLQPLLMNKLIGDYLPDHVTERLLQSSYFNVLEAVASDIQIRNAGLSGFHTPSTPAEFESWAESIQVHLNQPAAVFIRQSDSVRWIALPEHFKPAVAIADSLILGQLTAPKRVSRDTLGNVMQLSMVYGTEESGSMHVQVFDPADLGDRWGVVTSEVEGWRSLASALNGYQTRSLYDSRVFWLTTEFRFDGPDAVRRGLRIFVHDSLAFSTADLDTTKRAYRSSHNGRTRWEVYLSDEEQSWVDLLTDKYRGAALNETHIGLLVILMSVLGLFYFWILKLTKPTTT